MSAGQSGFTENQYNWRNMIDIYMFTNLYKQYIQIVSRYSNWY